MFEKHIFFWSFPKRSLAMLSFFFSSIWLNAFKEILSKFLHFWWWIGFKPTALSQRQYLNEQSKGCVQANAKHRNNCPMCNANKKKLGINHCPPKRAAVTVDPCASLCKTKNSTFLFSMSQLFICGLKWGKAKIGQNKRNFTRK